MITSTAKTSQRPETKVGALLSGIVSLPSTEVAGREVSGITCDSRKVVPGNLFFALPGSLDDGSRHVEEAARKGAVAVVCQVELSSHGIPAIRVPSARAAMASAAAAYYGQPSRTLAVSGVTGTNGKSTTAWIIRHLCNTVGRPCGLIGTIRYELPGISEPASRTTPESIDLQRMLAVMRDGGFRAASLEVSSHALVQERVGALEFDAAIFTNLTQDHLDFHGTMDDYFEAKARLFTGLPFQTSKKGKAVINIDDRYGRRLLDKIPKSVPVITFGQGSGCAFRASSVRSNALGTTFQLDAKGRSYLVRTPLIGLFNVYNTLAALAAVSVMGIELRRAVAAAATIPQVPGRMERVPAKRNFQAFVDYAHTPDALENVLRSLRQIAPSRIITVFGCGGNRDRSKRPLMASAAEMLSDKVIVTSDNPRGEEPMAILREVEKGFRGASHEIYVDRESAIRRAVELAGPKDLILVAGKGHEDYQEINGERHPFDDVRVTARAMASREIREDR
jgi:UDP-N-acetylmuramoyl-L-alanyl-D-glutamate--2,6-diaminopimelate ligase